MVRTRPEQLIEAVQRSAKTIDSPDAFSKKVKWTADVEPSVDEQIAVVYYNRFNLKKQQVTLTTFTVLVQWQPLDEDHLAITVSTHQCITINDRPSAHDRHEDLRKALVENILTLEPHAQLLEARLG